VSAAASTASRASRPLASWCPCPSARVPEKIAITACGRDARTTRTTSPSTVSRGQCRNVSSALLLKPKSKARAKYWPPAVEPAGGEQLLGADGAEGLAQLVADEVLPAVAAGERQVRGLGVPPAREPGDEPRVLVVGVRARRRGRAWWR
jgi:hypothetical protein